MTHMNWEAARRRAMPREIEVDPLPAAGSWADRRRYYAEGRGSRPQPAHLPGVVRAMAADFGQLAAYSQHIEHRDFLRKGHAQQRELLQILRRLVDRCTRWDCWCCAEQRVAIDKASRLLSKESRPGLQIRLQ